LSTRNNTQPTLNNINDADKMVDKDNDILNDVEKVGDSTMNRKFSEIIHLNNENNEND